MRSVLRWCVVPLLATTLLAQTAAKPKRKKTVARAAVTAADVQALKDALAAQRNVSSSLRQLRSEFKQDRLARISCACCWSIRRRGDSASARAWWTSASDLRGRRDTRGSRSGRTASWWPPATSTRRPASVGCTRNGIEALECLRADEETTKVPVVAVTASVTMQDQSQITRAGFDAFISKPISVKEFLETVNQIVGKPT